MDDDEEREFSWAIVNGFLEQAIDTFEQMDTALGGRDLIQLSSLGHFLKGSSATLGLIKVRDCCEKIQNLGYQKDETGTTDISDENECLDCISIALNDMKEEYKKVKKFFEELYLANF